MLGSGIILFKQAFFSEFGEGVDSTRGVAAIVRIVRSGQKTIAFFVVSSAIVRLQ